MANHYGLEKWNGSEWEAVKHTNSEGEPVGIYNEMEARHKALMLSKAGGIFRAVRGQAGYGTEFARFSDGQPMR